MPLPKVKKNQSEKDFVSECMADPEANKTFPKQSQRAGVCYNIYKQHQKKTHGSSPFDDMIIVVD